MMQRTELNEEWRVVRDALDSLGLSVLSDRIHVLVGLERDAGDRGHVYDVNDHRRRAEKARARAALYAQAVRWCRGRIAFLERKEAAAPVVHVLHYGLPMCGFSRDIPSLWPLGHKWVGFMEQSKVPAATCETCRLRAESLFQQGAFR